MERRNPRYQDPPPEPIRTEEDPPCESERGWSSINHERRNIHLGYQPTWSRPISIEELVHAHNLFLFGAKPPPGRGWPSLNTETGMLLCETDPIQIDDTDLPSAEYKAELFNAATIALNSYNSKHQCHFELAHPLYMEEFLVPSKSPCVYPMSLYKHLSFIARSKESSGTLKLFFAEVHDHTTVETCVPVEPGNPLFRLGCGRCHPEGVIYHPLGKYKAGGHRDYDSPHPGKLAELQASAKKFLEEMYTFKYVIQDLYPEEEKELKKVTRCYARRALAWYEEDTERSFQFLEPMACVRFSDDDVLSSYHDSKVYVHITFKAKNKDPRCINSPAQLFFAELNLDHGWVTTCVNVTEGVSSECAVCRQYCAMPHPDGEHGDLEYEAGHEGGTFADAQVKGRSWGVKVELQEKLGASSNAARHCRNYARPLPGMPHESFVPHGCDSGYFQTDDGELAYYGSRLTNLPNQEAVEQRFDEGEPFTYRMPNEGVERTEPSESSAGRRRRQRNLHLAPVRRFIGLSSVLSAKQNEVISAPRKVDCQAFSTNCINT